MGLGKSWEVAISSGFMKIAHVSRVVLGNNDYSLLPIICPSKKKWHLLEMDIKVSNALKQFLWLGVFGNSHSENGKPAQLVDGE